VTNDDEYVDSNESAMTLPTSQIEYVDSNESEIIVPKENTYYWL